MVIEIEINWITIKPFIHSFIHGMPTDWSLSGQTPSNSCFVSHFQLRIDGAGNKFGK